jgi:hypothetical protein
VKLSFPKSGLRNPRNSRELYLRVEEAVDCDGSESRRAVHDSEGELEPLPPHYHLTALGRFPDAGPHCYAIGGELPVDVYESTRTATRTFASEHSRQRSVATSRFILILPVPAARI